jgi:NodT family efflux transporter outer membrane factor (OMF) lipoprotein
MAVAVTGVLAGCLTGPDYQKPDVRVSDTWSEPLNGGETTGSPQKPEWWTEFTDPTLDSLVARAVESNFDLKIAESRVREARANLRITRADLWPQVGVGGAYQRSRSKDVSPSNGGSKPGLSATASAQGVSVTATPAGPTGPSVTVVPDLTGGGNSSVTVSSGMSAQKVDRDSDLFQAGFDASWELDVFGGTRRANEAARADVEAAQENRNAVLTSLVAEVAGNYFDLREMQHRLDIARRNIGILEDSLDLVRARFEAGLTNELDVKTAEAQLALTQSSVPTLEFAVQRSIHRLGVLLGNEPGLLQNELAPVAPLPPTPPEVLVGLPSELLRRRPDIRYAERALAAATARIGVATADLFPRFFLTGSIARSSSEFEGLRLGANQLWSIGPSISWPVFDAGRIRANIEVRNARQEQALLAYESTVMTSLEEVENALVVYAKEQNRRVDLDQAVAANQKALDIAQDLYAQGLVNFLNVLDAQRSLFDTQDRLVQSKAAILKSLVSLYKALGGGWESPADPASTSGNLQK